MVKKPESNEANEVPPELKTLGTNGLNSYKELHRLQQRVARVNWSNPASNCHFAL